MPEDKLLKLYSLVIQRYAAIISEKEYASVSELRHRISPYNEFIRKLRARLLADLQPYDYEKHFFSALERIVEYIKSIENIELPVTFWMKFEELDSIKAGGLFDQALLLCALLRSLESKASVLLTKSKKPYVSFEWQGEKYLLNPESGSMLVGADAIALLAKDPLACAFNDLFFESYEE